MCILAGLSRLGFVTELLSKPIRYGYMNGIALTVLISQLPKMFGFSIEGDGPLRKLFAIVAAVLEGKANWTAFAVGAGTLVVILAAQGPQARARNPDRRRGRHRRLSACSTWRRAPASPCSDPCRRDCRRSRYRGSPTPTSMPVLIGGCAVALVAFADTSVLSRTYAARTAHLRRPEPGNGRPRRRQPRRRILPGLSHQQQLVAHPGGRSRGREDPADRRRRRNGVALLLVAGSRTCCSTCPTAHWRRS